MRRYVGQQKCDDNNNIIMRFKFSVKFSMHLRKEITKRMNLVDKHATLLNFILKFHKDKTASDSKRCHKNLSV